MEKRTLLPLTAIICMITLILSTSLSPFGPQAKGQSQVTGTTVVTVDTFEDADKWTGEMPHEFGTLDMQKRPGKPDQLPQYDPLTNVENKYVLGLKMTFSQQASAWFVVRPPKPVPIYGVAKSISLWVVGRNYQHQLSLLIRGNNGKERIIPMGTLNFLGWRQLTCNLSFETMTDISFSGLKFDTNPKESVGTFYTYLDECTALVIKK